MPDLGYPFRQARHYANGRQGYSTIWIVRHCTADDHEPTYAEKLGRYFATTDTVVSTHYGVDGTQPWQYVEHADTAYGARNPANLRGIHIEYCGQVTYSRAQWLALDSMLRKGAHLEAQIMRRHNIPHRRLTIAQLEARAAGVTTHNDIRVAFGGTHTDPGPNFPHDVLDAYIAAALAGNPVEDDDMDPNTVVPLPDNIDYTGGNPATWPASPATNQPTLALLLHSINAKLGNLALSSTALMAEVSEDDAVLAGLAAGQATLTQMVEALSAGEGGDPEQLVALLLERLPAPVASALAADLAARLAG